MLIEEGGARILMDPGVWSGDQFKKVENLDAILITHEHPDHFDVETLKIIVKNNPEAKIFTNHGVGKVLTKNGISLELLENGQTQTVKGIKIEAFGEKHKLIYPSYPIVDDTGYLIAEKFYYAGDAFHIPGKNVEVLALPLYSPWATFADVIDYAKAVKPNVCIPVHDAVLKRDAPYYSFPHVRAPEILSQENIKFIDLEEGKAYEF